jgi:small subunit ribosomal protein S17
MPKRVLEGVVVSDKMQKTVVVRVERRVMDPVDGEYVRRAKRYSARDEANVYKIGDLVQIRECRPISKNKRWEVISGGRTVKAG